MKKIVYACIASIFCFQAYCEEAQKLVLTDTIMTYGAQTISAINETANVFLAGTKVPGLCHVNGDLNANNAQLSGLLVNGNALITNSIVTGAISVYGNLQITNSQLQGQISAHSTQIILDNCKAGSILIKANSNAQTLILRSGAAVTGAITFESGNGQVLLYGGSYPYGGVSGGKVNRGN